jgi:hypothetical protein
VVFWGSRLGFDREMTLRLTLGRDRGTRAWTDGKPIRDGQRVHGTYGRHTMILVTEVRDDLIRSLP